MKYILKLLHLCKENNINLITVVNPLHETIFYTISETDALKNYIEWIKDLHFIFNKFNSNFDKNYIVWDFSLHKNNAQKILVNKENFFLDGHHATPAYGKEIIENINNYYLYNDISYVLNFKEITIYEKLLKNKLTDFKNISNKEKEKIDKIIISQNKRLRWTKEKTKRVIENNKKFGSDRKTNLFWDLGKNRAKCQKELISFFKSGDIFWISPINNFSDIPNGHIKKACGKYYSN